MGRVRRRRFVAALVCFRFRDSRAPVRVLACRLHFDVRLLQRVPYEGVSRMQTSLRRRHRDRVVRRGIGMVSLQPSSVSAAPPPRLLTRRPASLYVRR